MELDEYAELGDRGRGALLDAALDAGEEANNRIADLLILKARYNAWGLMPEVVEIEFYSDPDPDRIELLYVTDARNADGSTYHYGQYDSLAEVVNNEVVEVLREAQSYAGNRRFEPYGDKPRVFRITMPGRGGR